MRAELVLERLGSGAIELALVEDDRLVELTAIKEEHEEAVSGALFMARVSAIDRHLDGAFLDIGLSQPGFILARDARYAMLASKDAPIQKVVREGDSLIVEAVREAGDGKGARLTTDIRIPGTLLVFRPHARDVRVGAGVRGRERADLEQRLTAIDTAEGGYVARRSAVHADEHRLQEEARALRTQWRTIANAAKAPGRLDLNGARLEAVLWQRLEHQPGLIHVADDALHARLRRMLEDLPEGLRPELRRLALPHRAFEQTGVAGEIDTSFARDVPLHGGGRLRIEETAACVAIDVDGAGRAALDVDLDAAAEIGRQARLRNLGGTIVVDFVDLPTRPQRQRLEEALRRAFKNDPLPVSLYPMSPLGIVQISRARRGSPSSRTSTSPCPLCGGSGLAAPGAAS